MLRCFPVWRPGFVVKRFKPSEGAVVGRVASLNPYLVSVRTVQNQDAVDSATVIADGENSVFFRYWFPQVEQSAIIVPLLLLRDPLMLPRQGPEEWLGERKPILRLGGQ